ncbi:MAG: peptidase U32 family protein, partial [Bilophila sp.]
MTSKPEILAPAGDTQSFLAAMAAGADAVYLGLKHFSARMQADNFGSAELSRMVELADTNNKRIYVAFNTLVKPEDIPAAGRLLSRLARDVKPHGLILQDPGLLDLARQAGYEGQLFLSTLANLTHPAALQSAKALGADRVILPRELSIDEIKQLAATCPEG